MTFKSLITSARKGLARMTFSRNSQWSWGWRAGTVAGRRYQREVGDGGDNSAVTATLGWITRTFPEAPAAIWERTPDGEENELFDHPMIELLHQPNQFYAGETLWKATLADWHIDGNAYWFKIRREVGNSVGELWWVPHTMVEPKGDEATFITHYEYRPGGSGAPKRIDPADVVHFRDGLDPVNPRKGRSAMRAILAEVFTDEEAAAYTATILRNMGVPGVVISPKGEIDPNPDDIAATKEYVHGNFTGEHRGEALVLGAPVDVQAFGFSPEQMNLRNLRRVPEERITANLGVPAIVVGLGAGLDRSTFANYAEAREAAYESRIIPDQRVLSAELRFQLLPDFELQPHRFRVGFDLSQVRVLQPDEDKLTERVARQFVAGGITRAEFRRKLGYEATDDDEVFMIPVSTELVPALAAGAAALTAGAAADDAAAAEALSHLNGNGNGALPQLTAGAA